MTCIIDFNLILPFKMGIHYAKGPFSMGMFYMAKVVLQNGIRFQIPNTCIILISCTLYRLGT